MKAKDLERNNVLQHAHETAYQIACKELGRWDPLDIEKSSGTIFKKTVGAFFFRYVGEEYKVAFPSGKVSYAIKEDAVPTTVKVILLHYLLRAGGQRLKQQQISFKDIPDGGMIYHEVFSKRVTNYLLTVFSENPDLLISAGLALQGLPTSVGDYSIRLDILPRFPITYVIWADDDEFPARATVLFDATAPFYLPTEDIVVAAAYGVGQLGKMAKQIKTSAQVS